PADRIDPHYGLTLRQAIARGVEVIAWRAEVTPAAITLRTPLPVICPPW
ncbi:MAG TPA: DNA/RNA nuclease SfsA, partial [Betaproteobacteria bacterium]|nr:DNA/RNA nuclease SfsA [Betaproteobacteria bacterium]